MASTSQTSRPSHNDGSLRDLPAPADQVWPTESHMLVVDLEATCWNGPKPQGQYNEIIEIGWALINLEANPPTIEQNGTYLVKPTRSKVSDFCTELTTITAQLLDEEGMTLKEAYDKLQEEVDSKSYSWGSWGDYDRNMIDRQRRPFGLESPFSSTHYNIKNLYKELYPNRPGGYGMNTAFTAALDKPIEGTHHRGGDDARNIAEILGHLIVKKRNQASTSA
ncbi:ribonuclease H-like protein [Serendipita vermifera]|nr:ribonuclease H-like protein [Serendipita vermifera]